MDAPAREPVPDPRAPDGNRAGAWGDWLGEFRAIIDTGVDGIFVDHPDLGLEARGGLDER
ncbi:hypothetical protein GCM10025870_26510 [Agromyces marinus]|uniref:GP-PDE domain-containing protein n=1 Tax=Agromyces marinus TaxID=1389020 RepID=A0ABM8H456_9MICO|nr:hypothetical protein GCM10025870_26510 [Agromyces marinus]